MLGAGAPAQTVRPVQPQPPDPASNRPICALPSLSPSSSPRAARARLPVAWLPPGPPAATPSSTTPLSATPVLLDAALAADRRRPDPRMQQKLRPWVAAPLAGDGRGSGNTSRRLQLRQLAVARPAARSPAPPPDPLIKGCSKIHQRWQQKTPPVEAFFPTVDSGCSKT